MEYNKTTPRYIAACEVVEFAALTIISRYGLGKCINMHAFSCNECDVKWVRQGLAD
jgi:hypothetical protein